MNSTRAAEAISLLALIGLGGFRKFRYSLRRASSRVQRESALWRVLLRLLTAMVSGGTPRLMFPALAKVSTPWRRIFSAAFTSALASWSQFVHRNTD